jgi:hypothetical protein
MGQTLAVTPRAPGALHRQGVTRSRLVRRPARRILAKAPSPESGRRAHGEAFGAIRPACSMVEVAKLIAPEILVEIEADAVLGAGRR